MARTTRMNDVTTSTSTAALYVALELSKKTWKLGFTTSRAQRVRLKDVPGRDTGQLLREVAEAKRCLGLPKDTPVRTCYEAGRDGFWIHRFLEAEGFENAVVDPASIEVDRRARRAKTDRLDVQKLVRLLVRHHEEGNVLKVARVPPAEAEDERILPRQLKSLGRTRVRVTNAIRAALFCHGVDLDPRAKNFPEELAAARQWNGKPLPPGVLEEVELLGQQLALLERQIKSLSERQREALRAARRGAPEATVAQRKAAQLTELRGIGDTGAYVLATEFFGWREFKSRGEVGSLAGLAPTPFSSGSESREQGISKAGNPRVRALMVELAWGWLRHQPTSRTSQWFRDHVGKGRSRSKRKAIVGVARKLLVELWHFVEHGIVPGGATLKPSAGKERRSVA